MQSGLRALWEFKLSAHKNPEYQIYLGIGSNIQAKDNLPRAIDLLNLTVTIVKISSVYKTPPVGSVGPDFLNAVVLVHTKIPPNDLRSNIIRDIERKLGRVRTSDKNAPRPIDIDILIVNNQVYDKEIWEQAHLAIPLAEIIPGYTHPLTGATLSQIAAHFSKSTRITAQSNIIILPSKLNSTSDN